MNVTIVFVVLCVADQSARADFVFGEPENLGSTVNTAYMEAEFDMSLDGLELYFGSDRPGGRGGSDIWVTTRTTVDSDWSIPVVLGPAVNGPKDDYAPSISADKLSLYFGSDRQGGIGSHDIYVATRPTIEDPWEAPVNLGPIVNTSAYESKPSISSDGLSLFFGSNREKTGTAYAGLCYIYVTTRATLTDPWGEPTPLGSEVNPGLGFDSDWPSISEDGLSLFFSHWLGDTAHMWVATRVSVSDSWSRSVSLGLFGVCPCFGPDRSTMYFVSGQYGGYGDADLLQVSLNPLVDFNGDGAVDCLDVCDLVDHWGTDSSLYDIGPTPFGDGIVDVQDLIVLAEHMAVEVDVANTTE
jgi:hypothetical protein